MQKKTSMDELPSLSRIENEEQATTPSNNSDNQFLPIPEEYMEDETSPDKKDPSKEEQPSSTKQNNQNDSSKEGDRVQMIMIFQHLCLYSKLLHIHADTLLDRLKGSSDKITKQLFIDGINHFEDLLKKSSEPVKYFHQCGPVSGDELLGSMYDTFLQDASFTEVFHDMNQLLDIRLAETTFEDAKKAAKSDKVSSYLDHLKETYQPCSKQLDEIEKKIESFKQAVVRYVDNAQSPLTLRLLYHTFDTDFNGCISFTEFAMGLQKYCHLMVTHPTTTMDILHILFLMMDSDGNGEIDFEEFYACLSHSTARVEAFRETIANQYGQSEETLEQLFMQLSEGGESVSLEQFEKGFTNLGFDGTHLLFQHLFHDILPQDATTLSQSDIIQGFKHSE
eukprot:CAMPEP_0117433256 /NCGR_PEP_ID=MMETSP0758-20121206/12638_1 /TAXON_ID=63605 /ORGANISM="Percolomonas cosmopolitus, Strain AE-1 (ATCC 50343)" /LENGTH=392 /DNA_ID=CAMNT_0005223779 /DNA_START=321 /DNA_END=1500 /DNA_ORIENTATION=+